MVLTYVAGNVLGRLLASDLIAWLVCLGLCNGNWRAALQRRRVRLAVPKRASCQIGWRLRPCGRVGMDLGVRYSGK